MWTFTFELPMMLAVKATLLLIFRVRATFGVGGGGAVGVAGSSEDEAVVVICTLTFHHELHEQIIPTQNPPTRRPVTNPTMHGNMDPASANGC